MIAAEPKTHPMLFSAPMVRALLEGRKTQTRRIVKPQPTPLDPRNSMPGLYCAGDMAWRAKNNPHGCFTVSCKPNGPDGWAEENSPIKVGERSWVRETWGEGWTFMGERRAVFYRATMDGLAQNNCVLNRDPQLGASAPKTMKWRPSIHMPRWVSRIELEVTAVRIERLQDISERDCWAEGIEEVMYDFDDIAQINMANRLGCCVEDAKPLYALLWESINGPDSWAANPFVWVYEFRVLTGGTQ